MYQLKTWFIEKLKQVKDDRYFITIIFIIFSSMLSGSRKMKL